MGNLWLKEYKVKKGNLPYGNSLFAKSYHQKVLRISLKQNSQTGTEDTKGATATLP